MTTPYRKAKRNWKVIVVAALILIASVFANLALRERGYDLNQLIYDQCIANEIQDAVIVSQLEAAKGRALASLPPGSLILQEQLLILQDGINALEPTDEETCEPPEGTTP